MTRATDDALEYAFRKVAEEQRAKQRPTTPPTVTPDAVSALVRPASRRAAPKARASVETLVEAPRRYWPALHDHAKAQGYKVDAKAGPNGSIRISSTPAATQELRRHLARILEGEL